MDEWMVGWIDRWIDSQMGGELVGSRQWIQIV